jgi:hypothetical protein
MVFSFDSMSFLDRKIVSDDIGRPRTAAEALKSSVSFPIQENWVPSSSNTNSTAIATGLNKDHRVMLTQMQASLKSANSSSEIRRRNNSTWTNGNDKSNSTLEGAGRSRANSGTARNDMKSATQFLKYADGTVSSDSRHRPRRPTSSYYVNKR